LQALIQERAERVVVPSSSTAECAQRWALVPSEKLDVIANCITGFQPVRERPFGTTTQVKVGFLGRLDPVKRVSDVVAAVALLNERFRLDIFGEGRDRTRIESEIARLKVRARVTLYGSVAKPQAAIEPLDVLVLPSEAEGFGLVLIEAMAAGVPVVATNAPGIRDVVQHEVNGLLVPIGDVPALRAAIECVVTDKALRSRFINNGLNTVREKYSWDVVLPQYRALLHLD
jgi:glycosyltransferase involved in cell wall biosynthesis